MAFTSVIKGAIKLSGVPDSACFIGKGFVELLRDLQNYMIVEIPNQTFSNIVISNQQPGQSDRDKIWWRLSNTGSFIGIYFYNAGVWSQIFPAPNQIFWLHSSAEYPDSSSPPPGYAFVSSGGMVNMTGPQYAELIAKAIPTGGPAPYNYYPAIYVGF